MLLKTSDNWIRDDVLALGGWLFTFESKRTTFSGSTRSSGKVLPICGILYSLLYVGTVTRRVFR